MDPDRPVPIEELAAAEDGGPPASPREAATVLLLRDHDEALEVLLVRRNPAQRFMGGAWVFPGGAVDAGEGEGEESHRRAAVRELREEVDVTLPDPAALVRFSRWITPAEIKVRFDTHFFLAPAPPGAAPRVDGDECVDLRWLTPHGALDAGARGELQLFLPTIKHLEQIEGFASARELLDWARGREVRPVQPRVLSDGETARIVLPGEPGYAA
jgi:8-oxo-dGTP pyrophosphatase MutT (NUDIX family)